MGKITRIFHGSEVWIEKSVQGSMFGITRLCRVMPNSHPEDRFLNLHQITMIDSFALLHLILTWVQH